MDFHVIALVKAILATRRNNVSGRYVKRMTARLRISMNQLNKPGISGLKPHTKVLWCNEVAFLLVNVVTR